MADMIEIPLDDIILRLDSQIKGRKGGFIFLVKGDITFPSGEVVDAWMRYDSGRGSIIDPLLQDYVLKKHVLIDE